MKPKKSGQCRLCDAHTTLVRSHIVPRAFFDVEANAGLTMLSNTRGEYPKRAPIGVYDRILCALCEARFGRYDDYAVKVLKHQLPTHQRVQHGDNLAAIIVKDVDYLLLKLFAVSVLWRASVSEHSFYRRVKIGPFEPVARQMILKNNAGEVEEFASWWSFFDSDWTPSIMDPFQERWSGVTAYRFYFGQVIGYIKVDNKSVPAEFQSISLIPGRDLPLVARNFENSADFRAMRAVAQNATGKDKLKW